MIKPLVSILIATYDEEKNMGLLLQPYRNQNIIQLSDRS